MSIFSNSIKHPVEFSIIRGDTQVVEEIKSINQAIKLLLTTAKGELYGDPDFGCNLYSYLYQYLGDALYQLIKEDIVKTLTEQDSRIIISESDIIIEEDSETLRIRVSYTIKYSNYKSESELLIQKRKESEYV